MLCHMLYMYGIWCVINTYVTCIWHIIMHIYVEIGFKQEKLVNSKDDKDIYIYICVCVCVSVCRQVNIRRCCISQNIMSSIPTSCATNLWRLRTLLAFPYVSASKLEWQIETWGIRFACNPVSIYSNSITLHLHDSSTNKYHCFYSVRYNISFPSSSLVKADNMLDDRPLLTPNIIRTPKKNLQWNTIWLFSWKKTRLKILTSICSNHRNRNIVILTLFSLMSATEIAIITTSKPNSDELFAKWLQISLSNQF